MLALDAELKIFFLVGFLFTVSSYALIVASIPGLCLSPLPIWLSRAILVLSLTLPTPTRRSYLSAITARTSTGLRHCGREPGPSTASHSGCSAARILSRSSFGWPAFEIAHCLGCTLRYPEPFHHLSGAVLLSSIMSASFPTPTALCSGLLPRGSTSDLSLRPSGR